MGASRLRKRRLSTLYVRVPRQDWPAVKRGLKTEFRMAGVHASNLTSVATPSPVIAWCPVRYGPEPEQVLMVLEDAHRERLGEISPDSLAREGFATRKEFIHYWKQRGNAGRGWARQPFKPLAEVLVYRLRPWTEDDIETLGNAMLMRLYGHALETE